MTTTSAFIIGQAVPRPRRTGEILRVEFRDRHYAHVITSNGERLTITSTTMPGFLRQMGYDFLEIPRDGGTAIMQSIADNARGRTIAYTTTTLVGDLITMDFLQPNEAQ